MRNAINILKETLKMAVYQNLTWLKILSVLDWNLGELGLVLYVEYMVFDGDDEIKKAKSLFPTGRFWWTNS